MTFSWAESELEQDIWIGLPPFHYRAVDWRLAAGKIETFSSQVKSSPTQDLDISQPGCEIVILSSTNTSHTVSFYPLCLFKHNKQEVWWRGDEGEKEEGEGKEKYRMAAPFGTVVDSLRQERSIQYMSPPLAWLWGVGVKAKQLKQLNSLDYMGIRALAIKGLRHNNIGKRKQNCRTLHI